MATYGIEVSDQVGPIGPGYPDVLARCLFAEQNPSSVHIENFDNTRPFMFVQFFDTGSYAWAYNAANYNPTTKTYSSGAMAGFILLVVW